jgi:hypothetical protein
LGVTVAPASRRQPPLTLYTRKSSGHSWLNLAAGLAFNEAENDVGIALRRGGAGRAAC